MISSRSSRNAEPILRRFFYILCFACQVASADVAIFAGGCFWCMEPVFDKVPGVTKTIVGYSGGHTKNPSYEQVTQGNTGHVEAIQVEYNPSEVSYTRLLSLFWRNIDPLDDGGQFCDRGSSYRAVIFYVNEEQRHLAQESKQKLVDTMQFDEIVTPITAASEFYPAEEYHQEYYLKNPIRYKYYRYRCGRDQRLNELWK